MALRRSGATYDLRSPDLKFPRRLLELPLPDSPAPATEAIAKTATTVITAPARRPPRPHNAFERASPPEPRPQRAFERSSLFARCRIYPSSLLPYSVQVGRKTEGERKGGLGHGCKTSL